MGDLELIRFAVPRRTYTMSHVEYAVDRVTWLYQNRHLIKGHTFNFEPPVLRLSSGKLDPMNRWGAKLVAAFEAEFSEEC